MRDDDDDVVVVVVEDENENAFFSSFDVSTSETGENREGVVRRDTEIHTR